MRRLVRVSLAAVLVVATLGPLAPVGAVAPVAAQSGDGGGSPRTDPDADTVGWEDGYWYDDPIDVDQSDGLSDAELDRFVARSMARVERLREAEFESSVPVEVISREDYVNRTQNESDNATYAAWNNQVWEALFVDGEDSNVQEELRSTFGSSVAGFYSPDDDEIKIITTTPDSPTIDNGTLVHELVHALQDQRFDLTKAKYGGDTQDAQLAADGIVEGEASYIEALYRQKCESGEWACVATPPRGSSGGGERPNVAILLTLLQPYSDGPVYVHERYEAGGWDAVDAAMRNPPNSTEQVIHVTEEEPAEMSVEDRGRNGWSQFGDGGVAGADVAGEASIFVMFWYQARTNDATSLDPSVIGRTDGQFDRYNYDAPPSDGWAGDRIAPYRKQGGENGTRYGYVWVTEWDSESDAREFHEAYRSVLRVHDARRTEEGIHVIEDGPFADAFLVSRNGTRVTIVNGPDPAAVRDIRPGVEPDESGGITGGTAPGFGVLGALAGVVVAAAVLAGLRRRR